MRRTNESDNEATRIPHIGRFIGRSMRQKTGMATDGVEEGRRGRIVGYLTRGVHTQASTRRAGADSPAGCIRRRARAGPTPGTRRAAVDEHALDEHAVGVPREPA